MSAPDPRVRRPSPVSWVRRIAAVVAMSALVFVVLWLMAFSLLTSLLVSAGCCVVVVAAGSVWDVAVMVLDAIAAVVFGIFAVIAAIFAAIVGLFGM